jgi:uncharacterized membrane protein YphA (DoxX/SURF4 family)
MFMTILAVALAIAFIALGAARVMAIPYMTNLARTLGIHLAQFRVAGMLEILFGLLVLGGIWIEWMGTVGSLLMTAAAALAIVAHARANDILQNYILPAVLLVLSFSLFLGYIYG